MTDEGNHTTAVPDASRQAALNSLFDNLPEPYEERLQALQAIRHAFYAALGKNYETALNVQAHAKPQSTVEERNALASWINQSVKQLGLSLVCPRTHRPATLISDFATKGERHILRFRFQTTDASGKVVRSGASTELPHLELMQAPQRVENLSRSFKDRPSSSPGR